MTSPTADFEGDRQRFDGVENYLDAPLAMGATTIQFKTSLQRAYGFDIPTIDYAGAGTYLPMGILDINYRLKEILYVTQYVSGGTQATVLRGQEGTVDQSHEANRKAVHTATVQDYLDVQEHDDDPDAHHGIIEQRAGEVMEEHLTEHEGEGDPHSQYILKAHPIIDGPASVNGDLTVSGTLLVPPGATLRVEGTLVITGVLRINGYQLIIGPDAPGSPGENLVFIETVD